MDSKSEDLTTLPPEPVAKGEMPEEPREVLASRLIDAWCADKGKQIPWAKAVQIVAIVTKQPDQERDRLLRMGDEGGSCGMCGRSDASLEAELGVEWPEEPTEEMLEAGYQAACGHDWPKNWSDGGMTPELYTAKVVYKAMRAAHLAAPQKP